MLNAAPLVLCDNFLQIKRTDKRFVGCKRSKSSWWMSPIRLNFIGRQPLFLFVNDGLQYTKRREFHVKFLVQDESHSVPAKNFSI